MRYVNAIILPVFVLALTIVLVPSFAQAGSCATLIVDDAAWRCCNFRASGIVCIPTDILC